MVGAHGLGERAGNASLAEVATVAADHGRRATRVDLTALARISELVSRASGRPIGANAPVTGRDVFTHTAGVHADGDAKGDLYVSRLRAERFGRERTYALGKLSGRASLALHLERMGISLSEEQHGELLRQVVALGDRKERVTAGVLAGLVEELSRGGSY